MSEVRPKSMQHMLWEGLFPVHLERCRGFDSLHLVLFMMVVFLSLMICGHIHNTHVIDTAEKRREFSDAEPTQYVAT
jgi:hypothetical protein